MNAHSSTHSTGTSPRRSLRIAVIGHKGRMGAMLARQWTMLGHTVLGADREERSSEAGLPDTPGVRAGQGHVSGTRRSSSCFGAARKNDTLPHVQDTVQNVIAVSALKEAVTGSDIVVLCVPVQAMEGVLAELVTFMSPEQLLCDITSVKMAPMLLMEQYYPGPVVGTHPLFGPEFTVEDLRVVLTPGTRAARKHIDLAQELFEAFGCSTFISTAEEHDRGVAFVQGLNFISSAAYFASLAHREELLPFLTPSFRRRLEGARKLLTEDAGMFQGFTTANPMTKDAIHTYRLFLDLVERGGLADVAEQARWWFEESRK